MVVLLRVGRRTRRHTCTNNSSIRSEACCASWAQSAARQAQAPLHALTTLFGVNTNMFLCAFTTFGVFKYSVLCSWRQMLGRSACRSRCCSGGRQHSRAGPTLPRGNKLECELNTFVFGWMRTKYNTRILVLTNCIALLEPCSYPRTPPYSSS